MRRIASSLISYISSAVTSGSMRTYFSDLYSLSTCSLIRKLLPSNVRSTSKTTSPTRNPLSRGSILTSSAGTHSPLK